MNKSIEGLNAYNKCREYLVDEKRTKEELENFHVKFKDEIELSKKHPYCIGAIRDLYKLKIRKISS